MNGEQGHVGWHGENKCHSDGPADYAYDKSNDHSHLITPDGSFLVPTDELHSIEPLGEGSHEVGVVVEMWFLGEEKFLKCFVFAHNISLALSLSRPRESCFFTASSEVSVMVAISLIS